LAALSPIGRQGTAKDRHLCCPHDSEQLRVDQFGTETPQAGGYNGSKPAAIHENAVPLLIAAKAPSRRSFIR